LQVRALEFETSKIVNRTEELNRQIDQKTYELKQREQQVKEFEREMNSLKNQLSSFVKELHHLKALGQRYKDENADLHRRTDQELSQNLELVT
jgi:chromosome segregation ATPase